MRALLILSLVVAASALLGWFGHKALRRVRAWGLAMNEGDSIFNNLTAPEERMEFLKGYEPVAVEPLPGAMLGSHGLRAAAFK